MEKTQNKNKMQKLTQYSEKYNGMMICSCGWIGCYFNFADDIRWKIHKMFCKEKTIRNPKEIREILIK